MGGSAGSKCTDEMTALSGAPGLSSSRLVLAGLILIAVAFVSLHVQANGGKPRLKKAPAGPYLVSVWTQRDPSETGRVDVSVAVMRPPRAEPVLDAEVRLHAKALKGLATATAVLERGSGGDRRLYHGDLVLPAEGRWQVTVAVEGPAGHGQTVFEVEVRPSSPLTWAFVIGGTALFFAVVVGSLWWLWARTVRRQRSRNVVEYGPSPRPRSPRTERG